MTRKRRIHSPEFIREAVRQLETGKLKLSEVSRDLDINPNQFRQWQKKLQEEGEGACPGNGNLSDIEAESRRLQREITQLKKERVFKK